MNTFELEFLDDVHQPAPSGVIARVRVARMSGSGDDEPRDITADCASQKEFDEQINRLIAELERIRGQAHRKFSAYGARWPAMHS